MNFANLPPNLHIPENDGACNHLINSLIPNISLLNQDSNFLKLNRNDTFKLIIYCFPMTGNPKKPLPKKWNSIPGAKGCTLQTCSFRDEYDELIKLNAIPVGISTQNISDIKEMTLRLKIPYDVLSDFDLKFANCIGLPTFTINKKTYLKRVTLIIEQSKIVNVFYPIFPPQNNVYNVIDWLRKN